MRGLALIALLGIGAVAAADDRRAAVNYMLHCQGCHLPDASGLPGEVPSMKEFLGYFLHSDAGRRFVVQVPGVATAQLPDEQLAELVNWLLSTYSAAQLPDDFRPYTTAEIGRLRQQPEADPAATRVAVLSAIAAERPMLRRSLQDYE